MKYFTIITLLFMVNLTFSQTKNFIDQPYIETFIKMDTLVTPDRVYLTIIITEKDTKGKISVEEMEEKMINKITLLGIDVSKQLFLNDLSSNFKRYFLKQQDVLKTKSYSLLVYNAHTAGKVIKALEDEHIANVFLEKTEYSKIEELRLKLKEEAIAKAKENAIFMTKPLGQKIGNAIFISDFDSLNALPKAVTGIKIRGQSHLKQTEYKYEETDIEFEKIKIEVAVDVKFKLE